MEDVIVKEGNKKEVREELLGHLKEFEKENWEIFGWQFGIGENTRHWLEKPERLADLDIYKIIKHVFTIELMYSPQLYLLGLWGLEAKIVKVKFFSLWLEKEGIIRAVSYAEFDEGLVEAKFVIARVPFTKEELLAQVKR